EVVLPNMLERQLRFIATNALLSNGSQTGSEAQNIGGSKIGDTSGTLSTSAFQPGNMTQLQFIGKKTTLSFYTLYSPQGTPSQGLVRVGYFYDEEAKELTVYEDVIGSEEDIKNNDGLFSSSEQSSKSRKSGKKSGYNKSSAKSGGKFSGQTLPVSTITDVEQFSLSFLAGENDSFFQTNALSSSFGDSSSLSLLKRSSSSSSSNFKMDGASFQETWDENSPNPPGFIRLTFAQTKRRGGSPSVWIFKVGGTI
ncbi:MAG: hypothetical protein HQK67_05075, partial [Desulfamplus sp.]|nr:hypothetical protein [Desulfamplus sp.]